MHVTTFLHCTAGTHQVMKVTRGYEGNKESGLIASNTSNEANITSHCWSGHQNITESGIKQLTTREYTVCMQQVISQTRIW